MKKSFEAGGSRNPSDKNQGRAGEFSRMLAEAQQGKDLQGSPSPQDSNKHKTREYYLDDFLSKRLKAVSQNLDPSEQRNSQEIQGANLSDDDSKLEYVKNTPTELKWDIFLKSFLSENFLDIYENKHDRCAAIEFLEKECSQSKEYSQLVAQKFVEKLTDVRLEKDDDRRDIRLRMISAVGRLGDKSVVPELLNKLSSQRTHWSLNEEAAIAGVAVMLDPQLAVPKLLEKLSDGSLPNSKRTIMAFAIGMSKDRSAVSTLDSIRHSNLNTTNENLSQAITSAIEMLESPSVVPGLIKAISDQRIDKVAVSWALPHMAGKLGDISVAQELVNILPRCELSGIPIAVREIGSKLSDPKKIKELADKLLNGAENFHGIELTKEISKALGELGKKLKTEKDVKELSNKLVAKLFDKQTPQEATPSIANAVFDLELHLAEPDPYKRFFNLEEGRKNACKKIKEKLLKYKQEFAKEGKDINEFYEMLSKVAFSNDIRTAMRIRVFLPIMKTAGPSFAPKLEELSAIQGQVDRRGVRTEKGWFMTKEEHERILQFAHDLRDYPSSNAENLPPK
jgi:HEAT repeat protein